MTGPGATQDRPLIPLSGPVSALCLILLVANLGLGIMPGRVFDSISASLSGVSGLGPEQSVALSADPGTRSADLLPEASAMDLPVMAVELSR